PGGRLVRLCGAVPTETACGVWPRLDRGGSPALTCFQTSAWGNGCAAVRACDLPVSCVLLPGFSGNEAGVPSRIRRGAGKGARRAARYDAAGVRPRFRTPGV